MGRVMIGEMGVTAVPDLSLLTVAGRGLLEVPGLAMRAFGALSCVQAQVLLISQASAECSLCFVTARETAGTVEACLRREFGRELRRRELAGIGVQEEVTLMTVAVGKGGAGLVGQVLTALGHQRVNVVAIAQGAGDGSLSLVVAERDTETAVSGIQHLLAMGAGQSAA